MIWRTWRNDESKHKFAVHGGNYLQRSQEMLMRMSCRGWFAMENLVARMQQCTDFWKRKHREFIHVVPPTASQFHLKGSTKKTKLPHCRKIKWGGKIWKRAASERNCTELHHVQRWLWRFLSLRFWGLILTQPQLEGNDQIQTKLLFCGIYFWNAF